MSKEVEINIVLRIPKRFFDELQPPEDRVKDNPLDVVDPLLLRPLPYFLEAAANQMRQARLFKPTRYTMSLFEKGFSFNLETYTARMVTNEAE